MKEVTQTILHDPANGQFGNCFSAVLASLLHLPIEIIPVFCHSINWMRDLNLWLRGYGIAYICLDLPSSWFEEMGIEGCHHEVAGNTTRSDDVLHAVVGKDGCAVFDPYPGRAGLTRVTSHGFFVALRPWEILK